MSKKQLKATLLLEWLLHMVAYGLILISASVLFSKTISIDNSYFGFWGLLAAVIIYGLNRTVKPFLVWLTIPITGLTLGLFYPFINVLILNMVDWILGSHFEIHGLWMSFIVAILISIMNEVVNDYVIKPLIKKEG
ncbi:MAG: phage holin family protein [Bacilli bacterium]|nr:phage holin family protein [Bacilli bacterium]